MTTFRDYVYGEYVEMGKRPDDFDEYLQELQHQVIWLLWDEFTKKYSEREVHNELFNLLTE